MLNVVRPEEDAGTLFAACAARTRDVARRNVLLAQRANVEARAELYSDYANLGTLFELEPEVPNGIAPAELSGLYDRALVRGGERPTYLKLRGRARYNRCPLCAQRDVKTLDHYLPKDGFPELAVVPLNLVPSCFECNHAKLAYLAGQADQLLFHPFYDDWSAYRLVRATIIVGPRVTTSFAIRNPPGADVDLVRRAERHFEELGLGALYEEHAAVELVERKGMFRTTFESDGAEGLRDELTREARSRRLFNRNSWQSALYRALARSDAFCDGGFEQIDEP